MSELSIPELERKKAELLRKGKARVALDNIARAAKLRRMRLKAEIKAIENPASTTAKRIAAKIGIKSARALFKGGLALGRHLNKVAREQNAPVKKRKAMKRKTRRRK